MNRKRRARHSIYDILKKRKLDSSSKGDNNHGMTDIPSAFTHLISLFSVEKFRLPPIVIRRQMYALIKNRSEVDRCLDNMWKKGEIRFFQLESGADIAIMYLKDYKQHVDKSCDNIYAIRKFMNIISQSSDISFSKNTLLKTYGMKEGNISELLQQGVLTRRGMDGYWLAIPKVSEFVKSFLYGIKMTMLAIEKSESQELLWSELLNVKLPKRAKMGILYHMYDIIGSDSVTCVETSKGTALRLYR